MVLLPSRKKIADAAAGGGASGDDEVSEQKKKRKTKKTKNGVRTVPSAPTPSGLSSPSKTSEGDLSLSVGTDANSSPTSGGNGSPAKIINNSSAKKGVK